MEKSKVLQGKEGWIFLDNDTNRVIEQVTNAIPFDKYFTFRYRLNHQIRHGYLTSEGIDYYAAVIPNKEIVYAAFLPDDIIVSEERIIRRCEKAMYEHNLEFFLYPVEALSPKLYAIDTYRKGDTHWNQFGAFIFYQHFIKLIEKSRKIFLLSYEDILFEKVQVEGDLNKKLANNCLDEDIIGTIKNPTAKLTYNNNIHNTGSFKIYENSSHPEFPTAVIFRDSFTTWMEHYIAESFSKVYFVHQANLDYRLIEEYQPDIVCSIQVERFVSGVPCDVLGPLQSQNEAKKRNS